MRSNCRARSVKSAQRIRGLSKRRMSVGDSRPMSRLAPQSGKRPSRGTPFPLSIRCTPNLCRTKRLLRTLDRFVENSPRMKRISRFFTAANSLRLTLPAATPLKVRPFTRVRSFRATKARTTTMRTRWVEKTSRRAALDILAMSTRRQRTPPTFTMAGAMAAAGAGHARTEARPRSEPKTARAKMASGVETPKRYLRRHSRNLERPPRGYVYTYAVLHGTPMETARRFPSRHLLSRLKPPRPKKSLDWNRSLSTETVSIGSAFVQKLSRLEPPRSKKCLDWNRSSSTETVSIGTAFVQKLSRLEPPRSKKCLDWNRLR